MISSARVCFHDFLLKVFSLALAVLIWFTVEIKGLTCRI
jgi:hypothetical protein